MLGNRSEYFFMYNLKRTHKFHSDPIQPKPLSVKPPD